MSCPAVAEPEEEFHDQQRIRLLSDLEQLIGLTVPPTTWAFLWLADIENLERWVKAGREELYPGSVRLQLCEFEHHFKTIAKCTVILGILLSS